MTEISSTSRQKLQSLIDRGQANIRLILAPPRTGSTLVEAILSQINLDGGGRVRFQRDMGVNNAVGPGVSVIWNPNLILNFPDQLKDAVTDWREVAP